MHGTFKGEPPRRRPSPRSGAGLSLVVRILGREAAVGCVLYAVVGRCPGLNAVLCLVVLVGLSLATRRDALLARRDASGLLVECLVVFSGGLLVRELLVRLPMLLAGHP
ncbi:MAG: hypothetical protein ACRYGP_08025 [Janthinobacterium lividum]